MNKKDKDYNIKVMVKDNRVSVMVRKMEKDEMPDDGIVYYCRQEGQIYMESELFKLTK